MLEGISTTPRRRQPRIGNTSIPYDAAPADDGILFVVRRMAVLIRTYINMYIRIYYSFESDIGNWSL